ncbi:MAG: UDP-N-acetylmuramoyl-L-alanine--D-glutamate ligase [Patescibacteria group bacterium]|nr:UDP-N-acetylmuramoyl-L-alanine--D-glutamate ligase [Patescibacteria group bacterium]MDD5295021.1 UDP-N-acetylmuramoyl-L-alanine--D-glutamate ligase [Patescibacteria group bacterium]MDD5554269.1 UDP-N-acetylmuramoyl-L-alanine--D-glutamate ligase [Patescibacteria group bacterium]
MTLNSLTNKKICILGYGMENRALVDFLIKKKIPCQITVCDARNNVKTNGRSSLGRSSQHIIWRLGKNYNKDLSKFDIIFRIAGYPLSTPAIKKAKKSGVKISSPVKLFFDLCPSKNIIGVTGTKGKGTTASLIAAILKQGGKGVWLAGNIGVPMFSFLPEIKKNDWVILELSSFQLEDMETSPKIAVITNFYREHLKPVDPVNPNYHRNLSSYWAAKANIFKYQKMDDKLIANNKLNKIIKNYHLKSKVIYFSKSNLASQLLGEHNKENIAAALAVVKSIGIKEGAIAKAVAGFKGLEHRLELVTKKNGVSFYNDSFATTPENTIAAINSFSSPLILLAGGADKGSEFKLLAKIMKKRVKFAVLFPGKATRRLKGELILTGFSKNKMKLAGNMGEAIKIAREEAKSGDIILLSPACASFGLFKNYKERGELFKKEVKKL